MLQGLKAVAMPHCSLSHCSEHHLSHAASAFFPSPFQEAAVLTMDGVGEWTTTSLALGYGRSFTLTHEWRLHLPQLDPKASNLHLMIIAAQVLDVPICSPPAQIPGLVQTRLWILAE
jgi:hypothetical protein